MNGDLRRIDRASPSQGGRVRGHLFWTPPGYEERERWPLLLYLHGKGERGEDPHRAAVHGPLREVAQGRPVPACILAPSCPALEGEGEDAASWTRWDDVLADVLDLLDAVEEQERLDPSAHALCGISMGGRGTLLLGARQPERFRRLLAFCPWGEESWARELARTRLWIVHGLDDETVPCDDSLRVISAVQRLHTDHERARMSLLPGVAHDCWSEGFARDEVWDFLLGEG